jgi:hypothetical protein
MNDLRTELEKYSRQVLIEWILIRGFSFFPEELLGVQRKLDANRKEYIRAEVDRLLEERKLRGRPTPADTQMMMPASEIAVKMR